MSKIANYNVSLKCFLKNKNWEILILKAPDDSSFHWMYDFPWWRINEDEFKVNNIDILKREIFEETWIKEVDIINKVVWIGKHKVSALERKIIKEDNYIFYLFFEWELKHNEEIKISKEHQAFKWVKLNEIVLEDYFFSWCLDATKMYLNLDYAK